MSGATLDIFNNTLQKTNDWLRDLMKELGWEDPHKAYRALRATLHALRDRLTMEETVQLGAQLPMLIRGFYYEGWTPIGKPLKERHAKQLLDHVGSHFKTEEKVDPERVVRAVFAVLSKRVTEGEIEDIKHVLPEEVRKLWF